VLYILTYRGAIRYIDEGSMMAVASALATGHAPTLNAVYPALRPWDPVSHSTSAPIYSKYAIGQSLLALPLCAVGLLHEGNGLVYINNHPFAPQGPFLSMMTLGTLMTLFAAYGVARLVWTFGYGLRTAALTALAYALTTEAWPYAKTFFSEQAAACALTWAIVCAVEYRRTGQMGKGLAVGLCLGMAILTRTTSVVFAPIALTYLGPPWQRWLGVLPGLILGLGGTAAYDAYRYGHPLESGYEQGFGHSPWDALWGWLVSPGHSVFLYDPILLLAIVGALWLWRRARRETALLLACIGAQVVLYSTWSDWSGGYSYAARFLLDVLPLGVVLAAPVIAAPRTRPAVWLCAGAGFLITAACTFVNPLDLYGRAGYPPQVTWSLPHSFLANVPWLYHHAGFDSWVLQQAPPLFRLLPITVGLVAFVTVTAVGAALHMDAQQ
jgi:hypothetical protein